MGGGLRSRRLAILFECRVCSSPALILRFDVSNLCSRYIITLMQRILSRKWSTSCDKYWSRLYMEMLPWLLLGSNASSMHGILSDGVSTNSAAHSSMTDLYEKNFTEVIFSSEVKKRPKESSAEKSTGHSPVRSGSGQVTNKLV